MSSGPLRRALLLGVLCWAIHTCTANAQQVFTAPTASGKFAGSLTRLGSVEAGQIDSNVFLINNRNPNTSPLETPSGSVSKLDLKSPWKARHEYEKGYQLLMRNSLEAAIEHLAKATAIYPSFVAAHNALGTAYLNQGQNERARDEFTRAVALDDHLPNSYLNLGCAQLALRQYPQAEETLKKASAIAPLDLQLLTALAYGEFLNHDFPAVIATARQVHDRKHEGAAMVHYFAAGAWEAQNNLPEAQREMETLLREDPKSASADQFRKILEEIKTAQVRRAEAKRHPAQMVKVSASAPAGPTPEEAARQAQIVLQDMKEKSQIAEAEAEPEATCVDCGTTAPVETAMASKSNPELEQPGANLPGPLFRVVVDEVAVFFAATDHGKSVTNLTASEIEIRDDNQPPQAIVEFRNESQLPLRLGIIIDTSNSVADRFSFEQAAASKFLQTVLTDKNDLAFVVGVNSSVLFVQDFTADQTLTTRAINQLAPGGGTALWDAVAFAADKLTSRPEVQPVARILVVISDGEDNSSSVTLKQALARAQRGEVAVYTVSTRDGSHEDSSALIGDHALRTLSELTGGAAFVPGSVHNLKGSLGDLQQVIRGRYLVSYKPASFRHDGHYRAINITAEKEGQKLKVYARKGYYSAAAQPSSTEH
ncbi:MAG: VWA domain-containing protein [Candidatus Acidiferrales bacterium]